MGGITNLVDFSTDIWVALFFACMDKPTSSMISETIGRVWMLDANKNYDDMAIHRVAGRMSPIPQERWSRQESVVVIPSTGTVPREYLTEVVRIDSKCKPHLIEFLRNIGINTSTLFNDLVGYIQYEQDYVPIEALSHMAMRLLKIGEYYRAYAIAESLTKHRNPINQEVGYYLRGLAGAFQGKLNQAIQDTDKFMRLRRRAPSYVKQNYAILKQALIANQNRDYKRSDNPQLRRSLQHIRLEIDKSLWSIQLGQMTFMER